MIGSDWNDVKVVDSETVVETGRTSPIGVVHGMKPIEEQALLLADSSDTD